MKRNLKKVTISLDQELVDVIKDYARQNFITFTQVIREYAIALSRELGDERNAVDNMERQT